MGMADAKSRTPSASSRVKTNVTEASPWSFSPNRSPRYW